MSQRLPKNLWQVASSREKNVILTGRKFFLRVKTMVSCRFFDQSLEFLVSSSAQLRLREDLEVRSQLRRQCGMGP
jgi:hypothetical protein